VVFGKRDEATVDLAALGSGGYPIAGSSAGDLTGVSVASVPDLNGDKVADAIIGAPHADAPDRPHAGGAFVVYGKPAGGAVDLQSLGDGGYRLDGASESYAGLAVGSVGDMNGDGLAELVVGAPAVPRVTADNSSYPLSGSAYVVFGSSQPSRVDLANLGDNGIEITAQRAALGLAVAGLADMNGDNVPDIAVGAPLAGNNDRPGSGSAFIVYGRKAPGTIGTDALGDAGFRIDGAEQGDAAGASVDGVGDWNGDGRQDLIVAAPFASPLARGQAGAAYLVFGAEHNSGVDLSALSVDGGVRLAGPSAGDYLRSVAGLGDFDGDGLPDVAAGTLFGRGPKVDRLGAAFVVSAPKLKPKPEPETLPPDPGADEEVTMDGCHAAASVAVMLDDSGSMLASDPDGLRSEAVDMLISKTRNQGKVFGGIQFGDSAEQLFPPQAIDPPGDGSNQDAIRDLLDEQIAADNGGTDLNMPFAVAQKAKPRADAWILVTDGGHRGEPYADGHKGGPPTFVVGLGVGSKSTEGERLAAIAADTAGRYFANVKAERLQAAMNVIDSRLNCDTAIATYVDTLDEPGVAPVNEEDIDAGSNTAEVNVTWDDPDDEIEPGTIELIGEDGQVEARLSGRALSAATRSSKPRTIGGRTVRGQRGNTYFSLRINGVTKGKLRVRVRAKTVSGRPARVRTQVSQSRRRR
jgi:hypothetical protein